MDMCYHYPTLLPVIEWPDSVQTFANDNPSDINGNYCNKYDVYSEPEMKTTSNVYQDIISFRKFRHEDWKSKLIIDWTDNDTVSWLIEFTISQGLHVHDVPYYNFKVSGIELRNMRREEVVQRTAHPHIDQKVSIKIAHTILDALKDPEIFEKIRRNASELRCSRNDLYAKHDLLQSAFDEDEYSHGNVSDWKTDDITLLPVLVSRNDTLGRKGAILTSLPYDNNSKSNGNENKTKLFKKPPGRPKGNGKTKLKRPRNLSVPEYLWNLLLDNKNRKIIDWEDFSKLKFRFIKPDEVAKLWGQMKQNDNMTFEKFSRAMRYHYRQKVLVSVPSARLVYQFGSKGPDFKTQNPNFVKVKSELDLQDMSYS